MARTTARLIVYLDVELEPGFLDADAIDIMEFAQSLVGVPMGRDETTPATITGVEVGSCAVAWDGEDGRRKG